MLSREEASVEAEASTQEVPQASELGIEACELESLRLRLARVQQELLDSARLQVDDGCGVLDDLGDRRLAAAFRVRDATEALVRGPRGVERRCTARYDERSVRCIGVATVPRTDLILTYLLILHSHTHAHLHTHARTHARTHTRTQRQRATSRASACVLM